MNGPPPIEYALLVCSAGLPERAGPGGLSHVKAMLEAERLQRAGNVVRIMRVIGDRSYEVDRYPPR
jgi:hypothetical protein